MTATASTADRPYSRTWDALTDPTLPLREPDPGPWLVGPDLFVPHVPYRAVERAFETMDRDSSQLFLLVTEWPVSMLEQWPHRDCGGCVSHDMGYNPDLCKQHGLQGCSVALESQVRRNIIPAARLTTQASADRLVPELLKVPAGPRGRAVVLEPVEWIDPRRLFERPEIPCPDGLSGCEVLHLGPCPIGWAVIPEYPILKPGPGCERWLAETRDACRAAGVPLWCGVPIGGEVVREWPENRT